MTEYIQTAFRLIFGFQMVFWGLNGFFSWIKITPVANSIEHFIKACFEVKFIMPTVKIFEVIFGIFVALNFMVPASLIALSPIMFVITGLHAFHNPKPWGILLSYTLPFIVLLILYREPLLRLAQ